MWFNRNKVFHGSFIPDISKLAESIKKNALAHFTAWKSPFELESASWIPPSKGAFKVNFDTTIKEHFSDQATVCKDHSWRIIKANSQTCPPCDPNYGEDLATHLALSLATSLQLKNFTLKGDSQIVIPALNFLAITFDWHIERVIASFLSLFPASPCWETRKINNSANFYAYHMKHLAMARSFSGCIPISFPFFSSPFSCNGLSRPSISFPPLRVVLLFCLPFNAKLVTKIKKKKKK
jgi:hypothetical protein